MTEILQLTSIAIEILIVAISLMVAIKYKKIYGYTLAFTFLIYTFYDSAMLFKFTIQTKFLYLSFFIATLSVLFSVIELYLDNKKKLKRK
jgi:hypothetical protein